MASPGFWEGREQAEAVGRQANELKDSLASAERIRQDMENIGVLEDLYRIDGDPEILEELAGAVGAAEEMLARMELEALFSSEYDRLDCIVTLHPGAGGTESQDWAEMLLRMYLRWAESGGFQTAILDQQAGDEAGIKSVTFEVNGRHAYGYLQSENGVHRLVRISPFDAAGRRHTSFASVDVVPQVPPEEAPEIAENDLRIDTYRSGGAGGQHLNKTDSAVRITHLPTGIVVQCQSERSQHANRAAALKILTARLYEERRRQEEEKIQAVHQGKSEIAWGSQIRSYVFHPYKLVKDHRTGLEIGNTDRVMDGDLFPFMNSYLHHVREKKETRDES